MSKAFHHFAKRVSDAVGHAYVFILALALIIGWAVTGPLFDFSETWQLIINTTTTIITFLMVFVIQHTQNANQVAMHKKLDELIRAIDTADNRMRGIEEDDV